jgi:hypothetical protein
VTDAIVTPIRPTKAPAPSRNAIRQRRYRKRQKSVTGIVTAPAVPGVTPRVTAKQLDRVPWRLVAVIRSTVAQIDLYAFVDVFLESGVARHHVGQIVGANFSAQRLALAKRGCLPPANDSGDVNNRRCVIGGSSP